MVRNLETEIFLISKFNKIRLFDQGQVICTLALAFIVLWSMDQGGLSNNWMHGIHKIMNRIINKNSCSHYFVLVQQHFSLARKKNINSS